jgi:hypothetical protein
MGTSDAVLRFISVELFGKPDNCLADYRRARDFKHRPENPAAAAPLPKFWKRGAFKAFDQFTDYVGFGVELSALQD